MQSLKLMCGLLRHIRPHPFFGLMKIGVMFLMWMYYQYIPAGLVLFKVILNWIAQLHEHVFICVSLIRITTSG